MIIEVSLNSKSVKRAIKDIKEYRSDFLRKVELFRNRVAEEVEKLAQTGFDSSRIDYDTHGVSTAADVQVSVKNDGKVTLVIAGGADAVWVEFGAGVYFNGDAGSSPHPKGSELGLTIGSYGKGHGKRKVWGYYDASDTENGLVLTHGTPATMPMYHALQEVSGRVYDIAREVFG